MAAGNNTKARKGVRVRNKGPGQSQRKSPGLSSPEAFTCLLDRFADACNVIEVACRSLENRHSRPVEASPVRVGLDMLDKMYTEFDRAIIAIHRLTKTKK